MSVQHIMNLSIVSPSFFFFFAYESTMKEESDIIIFRLNISKCRKLNIRILPLLVFIQALLIQDENHTWLFYTKFILLQVCLVHYYGEWKVWMSTMNGSFLNDPSLVLLHCCPLLFLWSPSNQ